MNVTLFDNLNRQQEAGLARAQELNRLGVTHLEKLSTLQLAALRHYRHASLKQLKAWVAVNNPQGLQDYLTGQGEALKALGDKSLADAKAVAELGVAYQQQVQALARESFAAASKPAA